MGIQRLDQISVKYSVTILMKLVDFHENQLIPFEGSVKRLSQILGQFMYDGYGKTPKE